MKKYLKLHKTIYIITSFFSIYIFDLYARDLLNPFTWEMNVQNDGMWQKTQLGIILASILYLLNVVKMRYSPKAEVTFFFISTVLISRGHQRIFSMLIAVLLFFLLLIDVIREKVSKDFVKIGANIYFANVLSAVIFRSVRLYYINAHVVSYDYKVFNVLYFMLFAVLSFIICFVLRKLNKSSISYMEILVAGVLFKFLTHDLYVEHTFNILFYCLYVFGVTILMVKEELNRFKIKQEANYSRMSNEELLSIFGTKKTKDN